MENTSAAVELPNNSTTVRSSGERAASLVLRTWGHVHPSSASRVMLTLFTRTSRGTPAARNRAALASGHAFTVDGPTGPIQAWSFEPSQSRRGLVTLVHGWNGRATQLTDWIAPLNDAGYQVVAFDGPGHGESAGRKAHVGLLARGLGAVAAVTGPSTAVVAHSLGAAAVAIASRQGTLPSERFVFLAPSAEPARYVQAYVRRAVGEGPLESQFMARMEREVGLTFPELDVPSFALATPTLVIHDRDDDDVPFATSEVLASGWPSVAIWPTTGLGHRKILRDSGVIVAGAHFAATGNPPPEGWTPRPDQDGLDLGLIERELMDRDRRAA